MANAKGSQCSKCGASPDKKDLHFHHLDPATKSFELGHARWYSIRQIVAEIAKCVVWCKTCHEQYHAGRPIQADDIPF